ncbi:MAG: cytochrome c biogenesis protein ResB [Acidobacteria bacterium]|nr:cytochrome c biogenesis protein ResB [Acidobacteriota bacterium]
MLALEETITNAPANEKSGGSFLAAVLKLLCSVRLGVGLLMAIGVLCFIGMLIMQQNVDGFDRYFAELTPSQRLTYGRLGLFDIYNAWYFNALLGLLSLNIILSSIERFPKTWLFVAKPSATVPVRWLREQTAAVNFTVKGESGQIADVIAGEMKKEGWKRTIIREKNGTTFVFGQSGVWNRFAYLLVHTALLIIFLGGFLTAQMGSTGQIPLAPGESSDLMRELVVDLDRTSEVTKRLPFEVICTDIQQKLIRNDGPISAGNTIDWLTHFQIRDETGTHDAFVQMNKPFDHRGYRFFQASFTHVGRARSITVRLTPESGDGHEDIIIPRNGAVTLPDGKTIRFSEFRGNLTSGAEDPFEDTSSYPNPAAVLQIFQPGEVPLTAYAAGPQFKDQPLAKKNVAGYTFQLIDFEKVSDRHILAVQRDPGANVVYIGFAALFITLMGVFVFSHQRVWAAIEKIGDGEHRVTVAGNANRNQNGLGDKVERFIGGLRTRKPEGISDE